MARPNLLLVGNFILNTTIALGCANGFLERRNASTPEMYKLPGDEVVLHRQEAEELRAAARYYEGEAQRSVEETGQDSERAQRYRDFSRQASVQAEEADRYAEEYRRQ